MPLPLCPNCNLATQTVDRSGVQFDMCPTCRGVWLDRGELEKLMSSVQAEGAPFAYPRDPAYSPAPPPRQEGYRRDYDNDDDDHRYGGPRSSERREPEPRRRRGFDLFEIFD